MGNFAGGNLEAAKNELGKALGKGNEIRVAEISLPIPKQIRAKRQQEEAERLGRQQEAERLKLQEADRRRQQEPVITRQQFLKWVGLGVAGLVTAVVAGKIFISSLESTSKTTADAPSSATEQATQPPSAQATQAAQKDALSEIRRKQLNADIRAREGRNDAFNDGSATKRAARDIESKVRSKLEANIPSGHLTIAASEDGTVTVSGTVAKKDQLAKIDTLPKQITGVTKIVNRATVAQE
ncbi:BON domain-containing protein [Brasilonema bromeliae]|uniref:BON domain-containing protein n=1 Tax=Brasilonema bromeliae SPC951 TaxID=385972 RepID=A0ABX1P4R4_9CYAN|nr:hypothetical protein [Brasilonema bromeliae SPC951]